MLKLETEYEALMDKLPNNIWILISGVYTNSQPMEKKIDYITFVYNDSISTLKAPNMTAAEDKLIYLD